MSPLTFWLSIAALVVVALFVGNAIAYRKRFGTVLRREKRPHAKRALSKTEVGLYFAIVLGLLAGFAAPTVAPESSFAHWLLEPYSQAVYFVWCFLAVIVTNVAVTLYAHLKSPRRLG